MMTLNGMASRGGEKKMVSYIGSGRGRTGGIAVVSAGVPSITSIQNSFHRWPECL